MEVRDEVVLLRRLVAELLPECDAFADRVTSGVLRQHPALAAVDDPDALDALSRSTAANVEALLSTLAFGIAPEGVEPPEGAFGLVEHVAAGHDGLPVLLRAYRLAAAEARQILFEHFAERIHDAELLGRLVIAAGAHVDVYADHVVEILTAQWADVTREAARSGRRRDAALRALLRGEPVDLDELAHPLDRHHLAVAIRLGRGAAPRTVRDALERVQRRLAPAPAIELEHADVHLLWCSLDAPLRTAELDALCIGMPERLHVAISDTAPGMAGFLAVATEAEDTLQALVRLRPSGGAATYRELALAATLLADGRRARRMAEVALGPLAAQTPEAERLRATLRAYFACEESKASAGAALQIHEKTVAYRLRRATALLGMPVEQRRAVLEAALLVLDAHD